LRMGAAEMGRPEDATLRMGAAEMGRPEDATLRMGAAELGRPEDATLRMGATELRRPKRKRTLQSMTPCRVLFTLGHKYYFLLKSTLIRFSSQV